jgi:STE24 endopeptidase
MRFTWIVLALSLLAPCVSKASGAQTENPAVPVAPASQPASAASHAQPAPPSPKATYTLTPERRAKAVAYSRAQYLVYFVGTLIAIGIYLFLWRSGTSVFLRNWARKASRRHFVQCLVFVPSFVAAVALLSLPLDYYSGFLLEHRFGLSTQGFASWLADWGKNLAVVVVLAVILVWLFYTVVRRSPRRWWFYFWLASIPLVLVLLVIQPYVIEPLFNKFTPLQRTQPALVERIETMLKRADLSIPPARIFEMDASSKTKAVDAYVSGLGSSKRVVVWDTTLEKMGPDELLLVLGHETGHYVLHHLPKEFAIDEALALLLFFLGFIAANRLVERVGPRTGIEGVGDLASLPLLLTVLTVLVFLSSPIVNGVSRYYEHQADQFGLEVAHSVVPDPNAADVRAFQILGEEDLADPDPSPFIKFWLYSHPPLKERIRFAASYKPWAEGKPLELLPDRK